MDLEKVFLVIGIIAFAISIVLVLADFIMEEKKGFLWDGIFSELYSCIYLVCMLICLISLNGYICVRNSRNAEHIQQEKIQKIAEVKESNIEDIKEKAYSGYKVYLNGIEVDIDNINLEYYKITIDNEQKKILMTEK